MGTAGAAVVRVAILAPLVAGLGGALLGATLPLVSPEHFDSRFEIYGFAGLHLLTTRTSLELAGDRYAISLDLETRGVADLIVTLKSHSEVRGRTVGDTVRPEYYHGEAVQNGTDRRNTVEYHPDGTVIGAASPAPADGRIPTAATETRGTVDQLTAYFMLERQLARSGTCALNVAVYDGRLRYDLHFRDGTAESPLQNRGGSYTGPIRVCDMHRHDIAGFASGAGRTEGAKDGTLWYAELVPGRVVLPVHMEFATEFGAVDGYLAEMHGGNIDYRFTN